MRKTKFALVSILLTVNAYANLDQPSTQVQTLDHLLSGLWDANLSGKLASGASLNFNAEAKCDRVADGFGVLCALDSDESTAGHAQEVWLLSYEEATKSMHHFIIVGESSHDHIGKWTDKNTLEIVKSREKSSCNLVRLTLKRMNNGQVGMSSVETNESGTEDKFYSEWKKKKIKSFKESAGKEAPSEIVTKLDSMLLGKWSLQETVTINNKGSKHSHAAVICYKIAAGFGINCRLNRDQSLGLPQEYWLIGYDKQSSSVHLFVIAGNNAHDQIGSFNDKGELVFKRAPCTSGICPAENMVLRREDGQNIALERSTT